MRSISSASSRRWWRKKPAAADVDGVICGHIHHAVIEEIDGIRYINTGDWVESCTAIAEHPDGTMELLTWAQVKSAPVEREDTSEVEMLMTRALAQHAA